MDQKFTLPVEVVNARNKAQSLMSSAGQMKANELSVSDVLKQKVQEAYTQNQDIIKPLDEATQKFIQSPKVAREKFQDIFNPFTRESLVSQYQSNEALPMLSLSNILGNRMGRIDDTISGATRAYQTQVELAQRAFEQARQNYLDLKGEFEDTEDRRLANEKFQWDQKMDLARLNKSGSGDSDTDDVTASEWADILGAATNKDTGEVDYNKAWRIINDQQDGLRAEGVDVNKLWLWQKNLAQRLGAKFDNNIGTSRLDEYTSPAWVKKPTFNKFSVNSLYR